MPILLMSFASFAHVDVQDEPEKLTLVQIADCSMAEQKAEAFVQLGSRLFFSKIIGNNERLAWTFLYSSLLDRLTHQERSSIELGSISGELLIPMDRTFEKNVFIRSAADIDFAELDLSSYLEAHDVFIDHLRQILMHGMEKEFACGLEYQYPIPSSLQQLTAYEERVQAAARAASPYELATVHQQVMEALLLKQPDVYKDFNVKSVQVNVKNFLEFIYENLQKIANSRFLKIYQRDPKLVEEYLDECFSYYAMCQDGKFNSDDSSCCSHTSEDMDFPFFMRFLASYEPLFDMLLSRFENPIYAELLVHPPAEFVEAFVVHARWLPFLERFISKGLALDLIQLNRDENLLHRALANKNYEAAEMIQRLCADLPALYSKNRSGVEPSYYLWWYGDFEKAPQFGPYPIDIEDDIDLCFPSLECADRNPINTQRAEAIYNKIVKAAEGIGFRIFPNELQVVFSPVSDLIGQVDENGNILQITKRLLSFNDAIVAFVIGHELAHILRNDLRLAPKGSPDWLHNQELEESLFGDLYDYPKDSLFFTEHACDTMGVWLAMAAGYDLSADLEKPIFNALCCCSGSNILFFQETYKGHSIDLHPHIETRNRHLSKMIDFWLSKE